MIFRPEKYQKLITDFSLTRDRAAQFVSPGMGKSAATLDALNQRFLDGDCRGALIVAPLRVATLTWPNEIAKWDQFRWMKPESIRGRKPSGRAAVSLINYERLTELTSLEPFDTIIFDEISKAKNPKSKRINHLRKLLKPHHRRIGLTGTPRPQGLADLFAQIRLLDDGERLGRSFSAFEEQWGTKDYLGYTWTPNEGAEAAIYERIRDLTITLRSSEYLDLPDTIIEDIEVPLPDDAKAVYKELEKELLVAIGDEGDVVAQSAAALVNKLLQITGGTVYGENREVLCIHAAKIDALKKLATRLKGERLLVFCSYIHERERVVASLPGAVDASKFKGDIEDAWNSGKLPYLVADPRSLGHGLNLQHGGKTVVWFSPTYSRELYDQANARVARKGQKDQPMIYRLISPGTVDDAVIESLRQRGDAQSEMLQILSNFRLQQKR